MLKLTHNKRTGEYVCKVNRGSDQSLLITTEPDEVLRFINAYIFLYYRNKESEVYDW